MSTEATLPHTQSTDNNVTALDRMSLSVSAALLSCHIKHTMAPKKKFHCNTCQKSFAKPSSLRAHTLTHTGEKPYVCHIDDCQKRFAVLSNLRRHIKIHTRKQACQSQSNHEQHRFKRLVKRVSMSYEDTGSPKMDAVAHTTLFPTIDQPCRAESISDVIFGMLSPSTTFQDNLLVSSAPPDPVFSTPTAYDYASLNVPYATQWQHRPRPMESVSVGSENILTLFGCAQSGPTEMINMAAEFPFPMLHHTMDVPSMNTPQQPLLWGEATLFPLVYDPFLNQTWTKQ